MKDEVFYSQKLHGIRATFGTLGTLEKKIFYPFKLPS